MHVRHLLPALLFAVTLSLFAEQAARAGQVALDRQIKVTVDGKQLVGYLHSRTTPRQLWLAVRFGSVQRLRRIEWDRVQGVEFLGQPLTPAGLKWLLQQADGAYPEIRPREVALPAGLTYAAAARQALAGN